MERLLGLLKVKVVRGLNLAICDPLSHSSDPYVVIRLGQQDDSMGDAEIARKDLSDVPDDTVMKTIHPDKDNCFSTETHITWKDGKVSQNIVLKLRNTDTGEIVLHLEWVSIPGMAR